MFVLIIISWAMCLRFIFYVVRLPSQEVVYPSGLNALVSSRLPYWSASFFACVYIILNFDISRRGRSVQAANLLKCFYIILYFDFFKYVYEFHVKAFRSSPISSLFTLLCPNSQSCMVTAFSGLLYVLWCRTVLFIMVRDFNPSDAGGYRGFSSIITDSVIIHFAYLQ